MEDCKQQSNMFVPQVLHVIPLKVCSLLFLFFSLVCVRNVNSHFCFSSLKFLNSRGQPLHQPILQRFNKGPSLRILKSSIRGRGGKDFGYKVQFLKVMEGTPLGVLNYAMSEYLSVVLEGFYFTYTKS